MKLTRRAFMALSSAAGALLALPVLAKAKYALTFDEMAQRNLPDCYTLPNIGCKKLIITSDSLISGSSLDGVSFTENSPNVFALDDPEPGELIVSFKD